MYSTVSNFQMDKTASKVIKMGQMTFNGVAAPYNWEQTALGWIERIPKSFG